MTVELTNPDKKNKSINPTTNKIALSRSKIYNTSNCQTSNLELVKHLGGKAANLRKLEQLEYNVPTFQVVSPEVIHTIVDSELLKKYSQNCEAMNSLFEKLISDKSSLTKLGNAIGANALTNNFYAVRSSAIEEDGKSFSYAGQFDSFLNVPTSEISKKVIQVWKSAYSARVLNYKKANSIDCELKIPCVIIQEMVDAKKSGVAFSIHPLTGANDTVLINSVNGLGNELVEGKINSASYCLKNGQLESSDNIFHGKLSKWQLKKLYKTIKSIEQDFSHPQDIEWAFSDNKLFILQSRNITTLYLAKESAKNQLSNKEANRIDIWDNSNIGESYPGVTTPMTFSFARNAYKNVYLQFCLLMGVSKENIEKNKEIFPQMLGYKNGRIYYNLLNWYRLLMLFPGYQTNKEFMEQMMGLGEKVDSKDLDNSSTKTLSLLDKINNQARTLVSIFGLLFQFAMLKRNIRLFHARLDNALSRVPNSLSNLTVKELTSIYRNLEEELLTKWDAPIVNDFFAMIFYGLLKKLSMNWVGQVGVHNQLLCGETGIISTQPAKLLEELAAIAKVDSNTIHALENYQLGDSLDKFKSNDLFYEKLTDYLAKFGDRSPGELKLETKSLTDDPRSLLSAILALSKRPIDRNGQVGNGAAKQRKEAENIVKEKLKPNPVRQLVFELVLKQARVRIKERENLRFERTRVFGAVRKIFSNIGYVMEQNNSLKSKEDIFFLEVDEVLRHHYGTATTNDLVGLVSLRKEEYAKHSECPSPPDRIKTVNGLVENNDYDLEFAPVQKGNSIITKGVLTGIGCCPGKITGRAKVITDPQSQSMKGYDILVAQRTDPGWITVISQTKAIIVEYGSLLSHTAIVARELGIPTIVAASGATSTIKPGDLIEIDGQKGSVTFIERVKDQSMTDDFTEASKTEVA